MEEFIFYTIDGSTSAPDGSNVENCQVLGIARGKDKQDALVKLLGENPWIQERKYDISNISGKELASTSHTEAKLSFLAGLLDERQLIEFTDWLKTIE